MAYEQQHEPYRQLRADRAVVEQAARRLRDLAIADGYRGLEHKEQAFALALVLDELARHTRDLNDELRRRVVEVCRQVTAGGATREL